MEVPRTRRVVTFANSTSASAAVPGSAISPEQSVCFIVPASSSFVTASSSVTPSSVSTTCDLSKSQRPRVRKSSRFEFARASNEFAVPAEQPYSFHAKKPSTSFFGSSSSLSSVASGCSKPARFLGVSSRSGSQSSSASVNPSCNASSEHEASAADDVPAESVVVSSTTEVQPVALPHSIPSVPEAIAESEQLRTSSSQLSKDPLLATAAQSIPETTASSSPSKAALFKKFFPMLVMLFGILFNYTILRDTKDVLIITAPGSGAEAIPFLKTWIVVPAALGFLVFYTKMSSMLGREALFYAGILPFLIFFGCFATVIYPAKNWLHPTASADWLASVLPKGFGGPIAIYRNWTFAMFYVLAELWGSVVLSLLFWGFANEVTRVDEAKTFYPIFGLGANVAPVFAGRVVKYMSTVRASLPPGVDAWGYSLNALMGLVVGCGLITCIAYWAMNRFVLVDPTLQSSPGEAQQLTKKKKNKAKMSVRDSFLFLGKSEYVRNLAVLVMAYGVSMNLTEVTWKGKIKAAFPDPNQYSAFMGDFSSITGIVTLVLMVLSRPVFNRFSWGVAAQITPLVLLVTGVGFYTLVLFEGTFAPLTRLFGVTPLMLAVYVGAAQNCLSKATKYSLFDPTKEMAYIPMDPDTRAKGKAAIDVVGARLGKSGGAFLQQVCIVCLGSLTASTPVLAVAFLGIIAAWMRSTRVLDRIFTEDAKRKEELERAAAKEAELRRQSVPLKVPSVADLSRCPHCLGTGRVLRLERVTSADSKQLRDEEPASPCIFCNGTGAAPRPLEKIPSPSLA